MNNTNSREVQELLFIRQAMRQCVACGYGFLLSNEELTLTVFGTMCWVCYSKEGEGK